MHDIEKLEATLWEAADNLRANSHKSSSEYCMPVLGVIFLRHATNRYAAACREIARDQVSPSAARLPDPARRCRLRFSRRAGFRSPAFQ
jgi:type I restriction enzyme M protein